MTYDKLGLLASATDALGGTLTQTRDSASRLTQLSIRGASTTLGYNSRAASVTSLTSANGNKWTLDYDAGGRVTKFTDPLGNATTSTYTGTFLSQVTLPLGTIAITSDADGRVTKRSYSDGTVVNTGFDAAGLLISADKVAFTRDLNGRIVKSNGPTLAYDKAGCAASASPTPPAKPTIKPPFLVAACFRLRIGSAAKRLSTTTPGLAALPASLIRTLSSTTTRTTPRVASPVRQARQIWI